jgi:acyl-[acyl-carrier-protein]-phospholipid O-acyltransferase / long-chain-fatty-acid--[acyl-carrier-protein] ligase
VTAPSRTVPFDIRHAEKNVMTALVQARNIYGGKRQIIVDGDERLLSYDDILKAAFALGSALRKNTKKGEAVGVLLPTGVGAVIGFFALHAYGRVPAMLNFTAGEKGLKAACKAAQIKTVVTAHKFVEVGKFEDLIAQMQDTVNFVYLEDVREKLSLFDKLHAIAGLYAPWAVAARRKPDDVGVILFTSGTEGEPKGVVLSHKNLLANVEQVRTHVAFYDSDIVFNPLPTFHCFGLTVGSLMPLMMGLKSVQHPSPLQARTIAKRVKDSGSTILLATDTFISQYARAGDQGDLNSLRLAVCGAERVRDETRAMIRKKYSIEILEGYGVTEAAPVVSANQIGANKTGTVGRLMTGMEHKLETVEGIPNAGRLHVRGPNVMMGYLRPDQPGVVQPLPDGWHDTGDVVSIDKEGFIAIRGRLKRFAKIGGEMVSLAVVENCASAIWPDNMHAAVAMADDRKGEQIVLVTDAPGANRGEMIAWARNHGVPELAVPRHIVMTTSVPVLGTGKTDYVRVKELAIDGMKTPPVLTVVQQAAEAPQDAAPAGPAAE